jgi:hypothetical protein
MYQRFAPLGVLGEEFQEMISRFKAKLKKCPEEIRCWGIFFI